MSWPQATLGDIFEISSSKRVLKKQWAESGVPFYRAREIVKLAEHGIVDNDLFISEELFDEYRNKYGAPEPGDLMVSAVGTLGACYVVQPNDRFYYKDASVLRFHPSEEVEPRYIQHAFRTRLLLDQVNSGSGSTVGTFTISRAKKTKIPLPPLAEQKRIAAILDAADKLRAKRREAIAQLDTLFQSTFLDMFGDPVTNPMGWKRQNLMAVFNFTTGKLDSNAAVEGGKYPFFTCARETYSIDEFAFDQEALLLAGNNANADYSVKYFSGKFNAYQRTYVIQVDEKILEYEYSRWCLEYLLTDLKRLSKGSNTKYLTMTILNRMSILLPPVKLQRKFAVVAAKINSNKDDMLKHVGELNTLFSSLQQRAFNGML